MPLDDEQYLGDGIAEELITRRGWPSSTPTLWSWLAIPPSPTRTSPPTWQVGKDLNVRYVVEGSLTRSDQNVRVTAQLIDATTGSLIWADRYDRSLNNIFEIRDDIMQSIAGTLEGVQGKVAEGRDLTRSKRIRIVSLPTTTS